LLASLRRSWNERRLCNVVRHRHAHAAEQLNALRNRIDDVVLLAIVLVEQQMELIEGWAGHLPMMFLVQITERHRVGEQLIQILDALFTRVFRQRDGHSDEMPERLDLVGFLRGDGSGAPQDRLSVEYRLGHLRTSFVGGCRQRREFLATKGGACDAPAAFRGFCQKHPRPFGL
jgi:hypothetical protein